MTEPTVELKNVKTFIGREGHGLNADVYINGVKCYFAYDDASGGGMDIAKYAPVKGHAEVNANIALLDQWIKQLPETEVTFLNMSPFKLKVDLESYIDDVYNKQEEAKQAKKFQAKMVKKFETAIVFGVPNAGEYEQFDLKNSLSKYPKTELQKFLDQRVKPLCKDGVVILNTNLAQLGVKV